MSVNNNNPPKSLGASSSPFGNAGMVPPSMPGNPAFSQAQAQSQLGAGFQTQYQLSQAQALAHAQAQAQLHAQFQAQLHAQGLSLNQAQNAGIGNLGSSSPSMSTPGSVSAKRILQKPPVRPPGVPLTNTMSHLRMMELTPAARKKKQKLPEKQLQDRVAAILPESALYTQLLEFEARVDAALVRKKVDIQEALKNPPCVPKTLRIYVFNTFDNQIKTIPKKPNAEPPTWTLKIIGRILEDGVDPDQPGFVQKTNPLYPKFSTFFKRVTISLDQRLYPENHIIIWEQARSPAPHEGFEVKRKGDKEFTANIRLEMNYAPEKFKLSSALMEVLGTEVDTRPRIMAGIWHYVKARKLQNPNDPSFFNCDAQLQKVFGEEKVKFTMVSQKISQHLSPPPPIHLEHKIKLSGNSPSGTACYDVSVDVPFPIQRELDITKEISYCETMASSDLTGKLEADIEIKASPEQFHDMFSNKPHHVHHTCYDKIQGCDLHEGEWGKVGTVVKWNYVHDGKAKVAKELVEAIDPDKNLITFRVIEGDLLEEYKSFVITIQASPKSGGSGSVVHWTLEYEKLHGGIAHPETLLQFVVDVSKDIDCHLAQAK